jgi:hypothetical protein
MGVPFLCRVMLGPEPQGNFFFYFASITLMYQQAKSGFGHI